MLRLFVSKKLLNENDLEQNKKVIYIYIMNLLNNMRWFKSNWNGKEKSNCQDKVKGKLDSGMWDLDWKSTWKCEIH